MSNRINRYLDGLYRQRCRAGTEKSIERLYAMQTLVDVQRIMIRIVSRLHSNNFKEHDLKEAVETAARLVWDADC